MSDTFDCEGCGSSSSCASGGCSSCQGGCGTDTPHRTITLTLEDNTQVECAILTTFPVEKKEYIALLPLDENGQNQDGDVYLYVFSRTAEGDPILANIEDDEEYQKASIAFDTILQNARAAEEAGEPLE